MESYPYANAVSSIIYDMISTKSDLSFSIFVLSTYIANPGHDHMLSVTWVIYIVGNLNVGLC